MHAADLKRAKEISKRIDKAREKANEARVLLNDAAAMAANDTYQGVKEYDQKDIRDIEAVIRIAVVRPLNQLGARWIEIVHGREKPYL